MEEEENRFIRKALEDPLVFIEFFGKIRLRSYQAEVARAVASSVILKRGLSFVVLFPRQSGKNEVQAQLESYLLTWMREMNAEIVKVSPTWKPQSLNAIRRLQRVLEGNPVIHGEWQKESGYILRVGKARIFFLSGEPQANIVGATASALLEVDEAQDVQIAKFDKDIAPMAASTNATRVFWGTAWTSRTLLARELRAARIAERRDGQRRVFVTDAERVAVEVPKYRLFVSEQVARLGRMHPMVRTQYYSEEIDGEGGMFPIERRVRMGGDHPPASLPLPGRMYAMLLDVAGVDEAADQGGDPAAWDLVNPGRDATALTIVEVDLTSRDGGLGQAPVFRCVQRRQWLGARHSDLYTELQALAGLWHPRYLVVDATGVGAGLAAFLQRALPGRVLPFLFNSASKSKLGWDFLAVVDGGRWREAKSEIVGIENRETVNQSPHTNLDACFFRQLEFCRYEILPGPEKRMRWGVPDRTRDPQTSELVHDDLLISAALCAVLDEQPWSSGGTTLVVPGSDPLKDLDSGF